MFGNFLGLVESELHAMLSYSIKLPMNNKHMYQDVLNTSLPAEDMLPQAQFSQLLRGLHGFLIPTTAIGYVATIDRNLLQYVGLQSNALIMNLTLISC